MQYLREIGILINDLSATVHLAGSETITGTKTFVGDVFQQDNLPTYAMKNTQYDWTSNLSINQWVGRVLFRDKNNLEIGYLQPSILSDNARSIGLGARNKNGNTWAGINVGFDPNGNAYSTAPTPVNVNENSTQIATTAWVNNASSVIHKSGNETIGGTKMFTDNMRLQTGSDTMMGIKSTNVNWTQTPSRDVAVGKMLFFDSNHYEVGFLQSVLGQYNRSISIGSKNSSDTGWAFLSIGHDNSNNVYTYCPPCDFINSILTTTGINKSQNGYVKLGNGIIIQWGRISGTGELTVTFPIAFSSWDSYVIVKNYEHPGDQQLTDRESSFYYLTSTNATTYKHPDDGNSSQWIAIGY